MLSETAFRWKNRGCYDVAQFDVHRLNDGLVVNCQWDLLDQIDSRFVVPLIPRAAAPRLAERLNPVFEISGEEYVMLTQAAAAVRLRELGVVVGSLADRSFEVTGALDVLLSGV
jgi:toxin CcdB